MGGDWGSPVEERDILSALSIGDCGVFSVKDEATFSKIKKQGMQFLYAQFIQLRILIARTANWYETLLTRRMLVNLFIR